MKRNSCSLKNTNLTNGWEQKRNNLRSVILKNIIPFRSENAFKLQIGAFVRLINSLSLKWKGSLYVDVHVVFSCQLFGCSRVTLTQIRSKSKGKSTIFGNFIQYQLCLRDNISECGNAKQPSFEISNFVRFHFVLDFEREKIFIYFFFSVKAEAMVYKNIA